MFGPLCRYVAVTPCTVLSISRAALQSMVGDSGGSPGGDENAPKHRRDVVKAKHIKELVERLGA